MNFGKVLIAWMKWEIRKILARTTENANYTEHQGWKSEKKMLHNRCLRVTLLQSVFVSMIVFRLCLDREKLFKRNKKKLLFVLKEEKKKNYVMSSWVELHGAPRTIEHWTI